MAVPERLRWAVETLDPAPGDHVLEIGCGPGVAADLVCQRLDGGGRLLAIDRSPVAIERATRRNAEHVAAGRVRFAQTALEELATDDRFDSVFAVNVNLFWTRSPAHELALIRGLLRPGGTLHLFYEPPGPARVKELTTKLEAALREHGYDPRTATAGTLLEVRAVPA
ncbi:SAM-dependent methyltransferase [Phytohabitans kaempferiae]|uniref:SAM-dependent methyltransferase n=1 Tax=Phytohabitans kaempferiae TaxID=1620943 RepID=A0ABV6MB20_9ACTN